MIGYFKDLLKFIFYDYTRYHPGKFYLSLGKLKFYSLGELCPIFIIKLFCYFKYLYFYYFKFIKVSVKLKDIKGEYDNSGYTVKKCGKKYWSCGYDWGELENSIKNYGLRNAIIIQKLKKKVHGDHYLRRGYKYTTRDGNHRVAVLKKLYGDEHIAIFRCFKTEEDYNNSMRRYISKRFV